MRYRIQVERGPLTKIVIFRPDEVNLPDDQKTYFTEVSFGVIGDDADSVFLEAEDLIVEGDKIGVDRNRLQSRLGSSELQKLIMPAAEFRRFLDINRIR